MTDTSFSAEDHRYMARAFALAERGRYTTRPNPRVGCVIVHGADIVGEGFHAVAGGPHAEVVALAQAGARAQGATAYVTLEPCCHFGRTGPCTHALRSAGIARVVAAMADPNPKVAGQGAAGLRAAGIAVELGLMQLQAEQLNRGFNKRMRQQRPWVRCKLAMSLDGRTAAANGESQWITGEAARRDVQRLRAEAGAILTGIGTVLADDPALTVRTWPDGLDTTPPPPLRVVLDSHLRMPPTARMLQQAGEILVFTLVEDAAQRARYDQANMSILATAPRGGQVDLDEVLECLAHRHINDVLVEAGPTLTGAWVAAGLVDELIIYMAPTLLGDQGRGLLHLPGLTQLQQRVPLTITDLRSVGDDWRFTINLVDGFDRSCSQG